MTATPNLFIQSVSMGTTTITNPVLLLKVDGVAYPNGYRINYTNSSSRNFYPVWNSSTGEIRLYCQAVAYDITLPNISLGTVEVFIGS